jgi:TolB-like protein/DNA-binding winged helix-turn-helix (wHTH) protein
LAKFELTLLGGFDLRDDDGAPVDLSANKAWAMLAIMTLGVGRPVSRERLAELLWGDRAEEQAQGSLRQTLSVLRKALNSDGCDVLTSTQAGLSLDPDLIDSDVRRFEALAGGDAEADLRAAVELYGGPLLDGLTVNAGGFQDWLRGERRRLSERACVVLADLLARAERAKKVETGLVTAAKLLQIDPLHEEAYRAAMRLQMQRGSCNEAIRVYQDCKAVLEKELSVEPDGQTQALYASVLATRDSGSMPPHSPPSPTPRRPTRDLLSEDGRPSIAVMPFENLSNDDDQIHFSEGITEDIITELSRSPDLIVIARNSTFSYEDRSFPVGEIGRTFAIEYVVKGSIRKTGNRVRVTVQLVEGETGKHIWAERYDRELSDVFELQDELTRGIVAVLPGRIENFQASKVVRKPPGTMVAYELLLSGKFHHHKFSQSDCLKALDYLDRAIELDPQFAAAYAWKACVLGQAAARGFMPNPKALVRNAVTAVDTALRLDENEVEAHRVQAEVAIDNKRIERGAYHNERALTLNPNDPRLLAQKGELLTWQGEAGEGAEWIRMAMRLDPYSSPIWAHLLGRALMQAGEYKDAAAAFLNSSFPRFGYYAEAAGCYAALGEEEAAARQAERALELNPAFRIDDYVANLAFQTEDDRRRHGEIIGLAPLPR